MRTTIFLVFALAFCLVESAVTEGKCGDDVEWFYEAGTLTFRGTGPMYNYYYSEDDEEDTVPWGAYRAVVTSVVIENGVTTIGEYAFSNFQYLRDVSIADSVTIIEKNGFESCGRLMDIKLPANLKNIEENAFFECFNLVEITIPRSTETIAQNAFSFQYESKLAAINVEKYNKNFRSVDGVLFDFPKSTLIIYPGGKNDAYYNVPYGVKTIGKNAFDSCGLLKSVNFPDTVITIDENAFSYSGLTSLVISDSVKTIGKSAFSNCVYLSKVTFGSNLTTIGESAFHFCGELVEVTLPDDLETIGSHAFDSCSKLTSVTIPGKVSTIGAAPFSECSALTEINVDQENNNFISDNGVLYNNDKSFLVEFPSGKEVTSYPIPSTVTTIGDSAFLGCTKLTEVIFPENLVTIEANSFSGCTALESILIGNKVVTIGENAFKRCKGTTVSFGDNAQLKKIGKEAFSSCRMTTITIPSSVESIGDGAFYSCSSLTEVEIGDGVTSIGDEVFANCKTIGSLTIGNKVQTIADTAFRGGNKITELVIPKSVESIGSAFTDCSSLTKIEVEEQNPSYSSADGVLFNLGGTVLLQFPASSAGQEGVFTVPDGVQTIAKKAFFNNQHLTKVIIGSSVTAIEESAFEGCSNLQEVSMSNVQTIGDYAFVSSKKLTTVSLGDALVTIGLEAFESTKITSITIPSTVTSIGDCAFCACYSLESITVAEGNLNYVDENGVLFTKDKTVLITYPVGNEAGEYEIPPDVTTLANYSFYGSDYLGSMTIGGNVKTIGDFAFAECYSLTEVTIENSVEIIGVSAFEGSGLQSLSIGDNVVIIGNSAFANCFELGFSWDDWIRRSEPLTLPSKLRIIGDFAFSGTSANFESIPDNVETIGDGAFSGLMSITSITFGKQLSTIGASAFSMTGLSEVTIPDNVKVIGTLAFGGCQSLTKVTFGKGLISTGEFAFTNCLSLKTVNWPEGDNIKYIAGLCFSNCPSLAVTIPDSVVSIGREAFEESGMTNVVIPENVKSIGIRAFSQNAIETITVKEGNNYFEVDNGVLFNKGKTAIVLYPSSDSRNTYTIPDTVESIEDYAFDYAMNLVSVEIGKNVRNIGSHAFESCYGLTKVVIPESVVSIGDGAFASDDGEMSLESVIIGESVVSIGENAFEGDPNLATVLYQGSAVISTDLFDKDLTICVPPYYGSDSFGGKKVDTSSELCTNFQKAFDHCHVAEPEDENWVQFARKIKKNATEWELKRNGCMSYECHDTEGYLSWIDCNSTDSTTKMCIENQCASVELNKTHHYVQVEFTDGLAVEHIDTEDVRETFYVEYSLETDNVDIAWEGNQKGDALRMVFELPDDDTAEASKNALLDLKHKQEGIFHRAKTVRILTWEIPHGGDDDEGGNDGKGGDMNVVFDSATRITSSFLLFITLLLVLVF